MAHPIAERGRLCLTVLLGAEKQGSRLALSSRPSNLKNHRERNTCSGPVSIEKPCRCRPSQVPGEWKSRWILGVGLPTVHLTLQMVNFPTSIYHRLTWMETHVDSMVVLVEMQNAIHHFRALHELHGMSALLCLPVCPARSPRSSWLIEDDSIYGYRG